MLIKIHKYGIINTDSILMRKNNMKKKNINFNCHCEERSDEAIHNKLNGLPRSFHSLAMTFGFTLAEVLITLTIIGVIAALTIPTLMKKYEEQQILTGVKAAYSILQNAVKMSIAENGPMSEWGLNDAWENYNGHKNLSERFIVPYLKIASVCEANWTNSNKQWIAL